MVRYHRKGSVIVMVVGLLVMLAMVGTTFIIIAHMDRRESHSVATVAPMKQVAGGVFQQIRVKLAEDLYFDTATGAVIYGKTNINYKEQCDFAHEDYDKHLASFGPVDVGGVSRWKHLSNHENAAVGFADVAANDPLLVDTNGSLDDGVNAGDAILFNSGVTNRSGGEYWVAYRLIDASSLMNINSAYSASAAASGTVMPITNIALNVLTNAATRDNVHAARNGSTSDNIATYKTNYVQRPCNPAVKTYLPFDISDMLSLRWGGAVPDTASGRLWEALGGQFGSAKPYLTVFSSSRDHLRRASGNLDQPDNRRIDLNNAVFDDLFKAFYNAIPEGIAGFTDDDNARRFVSAQLAVNVIDYRDPDSDVTVQTVPGVAPAVGVYGIERQPFITELFYKVYKVSEVPADVYARYSAIELFNPYKTGIRIVGFKLTEGGVEKTPTGGWPDVSISSGKRIVIVSDATTIPVHADAERVLVIPGLDLNKGVKIYRSRNSNGSGAKDVPLADATVNVDDPVLNRARMAVLQRDDVPADAKYSLNVANIFTNRDYTNENIVGVPMTAENTNLGKANDNYSCDDITNAVPTPVFVRNGNLINLGEVLRIFYVGPSSSDVSLDVALASMSPTNVSNGRLYTFGVIKAGTDPQIPAACMLGDYMDVLVPDTNNTGRTDTVYGRININTAPWQVIQYLPGIASIPTQAQRELVAKDIVAYRDLLNNPGGTNYSVGGNARANAMVPALTHLREDAGFASPGELAIPLAKIIAPMPRNTYGVSAPNCYKISDSGAGDDGLDEITGDLSKYDIYYAWLANQITVRSDVYIAYIRVQVGNDPATTGPVRRYIAVLDRSNCTSSNDLPNVLMFAELK